MKNPDFAGARTASAQFAHRAVRSAARHTTSRCLACGGALGGADPLRVHGQLFHRSCATYQPGPMRAA
jgi:hypothetical protein